MNTVKENEIKGIILKYLQEDAGNKLGTSDQVTKFAQTIAALTKSTNGLVKANDIFVDVYEYHHDAEAKKLGTFKVDNFGLKDFVVEVSGVGKVKFSLSGKAVDGNLDLFCSNPRIKK
jgi:hypothetical protein